MNMALRDKKKRNAARLVYAPRLIQMLKSFHAFCDWRSRALKQWCRRDRFREGGWVGISGVAMSEYWRLYGTMAAQPPPVHRWALRLLELGRVLKSGEEALAERISCHRELHAIHEHIYLEHFRELGVKCSTLQQYIAHGRHKDVARDAPWAQVYLNVFEQWQQEQKHTAANLQGSYQHVVLKLLPINRQYSQVPFITQTDPDLQACATAYSRLMDLDRRLKERLWSLAHRYTIGYRVTRKLLARIACTETSRPAAVVRNRRDMGYVLLLIAVVVLASVAMAYLLQRQPKAHMPSKDTLGSAPDTILSPHTVQLPPLAMPQQLPTPITDTFKAPTPATRQPTYGIDISKYQGDLLLEIVGLDSLSFMICKATEGVRGVDPFFAQNWRLIREKRLVRGAYHFYHVGHNPVHQARHFLRTVGTQESTDLPLIVDVEQQSIIGSFDKGTLAADLLKHLRYLEDATGRAPMLYTNLYFADNYLMDSAFSHYPLWLAEYSGKRAPRLPRAWRERGYTIWQKSNRYRIYTINSDLDIFNGSLEELQTFTRR